MSNFEVKIIDSRLDELELHDKIRERSQSKYFWDLVNSQAQEFKKMIRVEIEKNVYNQSISEIGALHLEYLRGLMGLLNEAIESVLARPEVEHDDIYRRMRFDKYYEAWLLVQMILGNINDDLHENWPKQSIKYVLMRIQALI